MTASQVSDNTLQENTKRRQIMDGARAVFLERGFDAASMGEIARRASVSKGTLYVYFESKEELFVAIFDEERRAQAEQVFSLDAGNNDVEATLRRLGSAFVQYLCQPARISSLRTVMSISLRMPAVGRRFYEAGPATGIARLASYLEAQVAAGILVVEDCEIAAAQFLDACQSTLFKPMMFCSAPPPSLSRIEHVVEVAVQAFMAAYKKH
jgi:AcrR family transcriptional regulator